jgi:PAS domain S-box-containing protein
MAVAKTTVRPRVEVIALYEQAAMVMHWSAQLADEDAQRAAAGGMATRARREQALASRARRSGEIARVHALRLRVTAEADGLVSEVRRGVQLYDLRGRGAVDGGVAVVATDVGGKVRLWNPAAERLYGWSADDALERPIADLMVGPEDAGVAGRIMATVRRVGSWQGEFWVRRRNGPRALVFVRDVQLRDVAGGLVGIAGCSVPLAPGSVPASRASA